MNVISTIVQFAGSLGLLLYGMKMLSDGIQKSAGDSLHKILGYMTGNRFAGVFTGFLVTAFIQSSGATTVMVVSFVNAGLMSLTQAIGVIFGANIGTTVTAWIVSLVGFSFKISDFAVPIFGIGFFISKLKKWEKHDIGEALMGFGLLFVGLGLLTDIMSIDAESVSFLQYFTDKGLLGLLVGVAAGIVITVLLHSSSAVTAIVLTLAYNGLLTWELSAAVVLGSNIGSTIDSLLASIGTKVNARRAALVHVAFNVIGTILAIIFFRPFLSLVEFIIPGDINSNITTAIATLHTIFNLINTILFLPFVNQIAAIVSKVIQPKNGEQPVAYRLDMVASGVTNAVELNIIRAEKEISDMTDLVISMFDNFTTALNGRNNSTIVDGVDTKTMENEGFADQMHEVLSDFLVKCSRMMPGEKTQIKINRMLHVVGELESMSDECASLVLLIKKSLVKKMTFEQKDLDSLLPYIDLVKEFLAFVQGHIDGHLSYSELNTARDLEDNIDKFRTHLKKAARKRLEQGADVRSELLYIDLIRHIEKIGDRAFSISEALAQ